MSGIDLKSFDRIVFFTGAGLSVESGIPTYRGDGGIWREYDYQEYACQRAFDRDPERVWGFHDLRRARVGEAQPNAGHEVVADVQRVKPATRVVTQNIDGLHQRAGATDVIELHGSLWRVRCGCTPARENTEVPLLTRQCDRCGDYLRPDIVWFEDPMNHAALDAAMEAIRNADLLVSIGTSGVVYPAAELPRLARSATLVEINPEDTAVSQWYEHRLRGPASEVLTSLWKEVGA
ncbi:MAG: NAD-dependent deacylase [Planctomycetota bacterium]